MEQVNSNNVTESEAEVFIHRFTCRICGKPQELVFNSFIKLVKPVVSHLDPICDTCWHKLDEERYISELAKNADAIAVRAGVPENFLRWDKTIGNNKLLKFCLDSVYNWAVICDRVDTGKTRACCRAIKEMIRRDLRLRVAFRNVNALADEWADAWKSDFQRITAMENQLGSSDLLVLDDLGKRGEYSTGFAGFLYTLTNKIYERGGSLWITSNINLSECGKFFPSDIFEAIYSRFGRMKHAERFSAWRFGGAE